MAARLPNPKALLHPPQTPYDRCNRELAPAFSLLVASEKVVPAGARVLVTSEPPSAALDTDFQHLGVALLPGRIVVPGARYGEARPDLARGADYVIVVGAEPSSSPGERLLSRPEGTVWRKAER